MIGTTATHPEATCSVLISAYNVAPYLADAVESALDQLAPGDEVVVVDDCSTDDTGSVLSRYAGRVLALRTPQNLGSAGARNYGAQKASGHVLAMLDGDDVALPGRLDAHRHAFARGVDLSYGRMAMISADGSLQGWHRGSAINSRLALSDQLIFQNPIAFSTAGIRLSLFDRLGGFRSDIRSSEDRELWARVVASGARVELIDEYLSAYRVRPGSKTLDWRVKLRAYEAIHRMLADRGHGLPDAFATAGFQRTALVGAANIAWRRARAERSPRRLVDVLTLSARALPWEIRYRWWYWRLPRRSRA
jgi:glycosyltransferase involved in cell wall biosynthesis